MNIYSMKNIKGWKKYFERELTLNNLGSRKRGDVLVAKLRAGDDIELNNGKKVDIEKMKDPDVDGEWKDIDVAVANITDDEGHYDTEKASDYLKKKNRLTNVFLDEDDGKIYKISDFKKTTDFGSSGSGRRIRENESIQALFLAKRIVDGVDIPEDPEAIRNILLGLSEDLSHTKKFKYEKTELCEVYVAPTFVLDDEVIDYYMSDSAWIATFCKVPNLLAKYRLKSGKSIEPLIPTSIKYRIYHISYKEPDSVPAKLISTYNRINKEFGFSVEFSKYNPADVFMVDIDRINEIYTTMDSCSDILELNTAMNSMFDERILIPISLKRSGPSDGDTLIVVNAEHEMTLPQFSVRGMRLSNDVSKGIGTKIMTISTWNNGGRLIETERNLSIDSPNTGQNVNIDGEIDGKWARHGKISLSWMIKFIEESNLYDRVRDYVEDQPINTFQDLNRLSEEELESILSSINADILSMERDIKVEILSDVRGRNIDGEGRKRKLISKVQSMQVIRALTVIDSHDNSEKEREIDKIVSNMMLYALSIKNPNFESPRYVRAVER